MESFTKVDCEHCGESTCIDHCGQGRWVAAPLSFCPRREFRPCSPQSAVAHQIVSIARRGDDFEHVALLFMVGRSTKSVGCAKYQPSLLSLDTFEVSTVAEL